MLLKAYSSSRRLAAWGVALLLALPAVHANDECPASAGTITTEFGPICLVGGSATITATPVGDAIVPDGFSTLFVLTRTNGLVIDQVSTTPSFMVNSVDVWRVHTLVYDPSTLDLSGVQLGSTDAYTVQGLLIQGGGDICASLDINGAPLKTGICECTANAGSISTDFGPICLVDNEATITGLPGGDAVVPPGFEVLYVLTRTNGLIIEQVSATPSFTVSGSDVWRIHTLVYEPSTLDLGIVQLGSTSAYDVQGLLQQGGGTICASLDINGAPLKTGICEDECTASAGTISADFADLCLTDGQAQLTATPDGNANVPAGYTTVYVLTQGPGLVIVDAGGAPSFTVTAAGGYIIHTLVYDPATLDLSIVVPGETTGFDVNALLQQGGGGICASLDVAGAQFQVADCTPTCVATAGTLAAFEAEVCLQEGGAVLAAVVNELPVIPQGYGLLYVLTSGSGLVIEAVAPTPEFVVSTTGAYTIHTLVYDAATLDLGIVEFGVTTGFDVNGLLIQGGGTICAALDVAGAPITVNDCTPPPCEAEAGTLTANTLEVICLDAGTAALSATPNGDANEPAGYSTAFVLTSGAELTIVDAGAAPSFTVAAPGLYTIHTLVYDPATLDLNIVLPGITTGVDVLEFIAANGICASLDAAGAPFTVEECAPPKCAASAGTLIALQSELCIGDEGFVVMEALPLGDAFVPAGYEVAYVLTRGPELFIQNIEPDPSFEWPLTGDYTIHTLVYDPATLDLSGVQFDVTTGFDINALLIQGGGSICAGLDVVGAQFTITECDDACAGAAGEDTSVEVCNDGSVVELLPLLGGDPLPGGVWFHTNFLDQGLALGGNGFYDTMFGQGGLLGYVVAAGPDCAPDTAYLNFVEIQCPEVIGEAPVIDKGTPSGNVVINTWPNPSVDEVRVGLPHTLSNTARIDVVDALGRRGQASVIVNDAQLTIDASTLLPGAWTVRVQDGSELMLGRFVRSER